MRSAAPCRSTRRRVSIHGAVRGGPEAPGNVGRQAPVLAGGAEVVGRSSHRAAVCQQVLVGPPVETRRIEADRQIGHESGARSTPPQRAARRPAPGAIGGSRSGRHGVWRSPPPGGCRDGGAPSGQSVQPAPWCSARAQNTANRVSSGSRLGQLQLGAHRPRPADLGPDRLQRASLERPDPVAVDQPGGAQRPPGGRGGLDAVGGELGARDRLRLAGTAATRSAASRRSRATAAGDRSATERRSGCGRAGRHPGPRSIVRAPPGRPGPRDPSSAPTSSRTAGSTNPSPVRGAVLGRARRTSPWWARRRRGCNRWLPSGRSGGRCVVASTSAPSSSSSVAGDVSSGCVARSDEPQGSWVGRSVRVLRGALREMQLPAGVGVDLTPRPVGRPPSVGHTPVVVLGHVGRPLVEVLAGTSEPEGTVWSVTRRTVGVPGCDLRRGRDP